MAVVLYKYRDLEPWDYLLDIFVNERLYAAKFEMLNDPMEGMFTYSEVHENPGFIREMVQEKAQLGICSLSRTHNNTVMWSYYAASHRGVVLGIEIDKQQNDIIDVTKVRYAKDISFKGFYGSDPETEARKILSKKLSAWKHENEVRVFTRSNFVSMRLREIYFGCQMTDSHKHLLRATLKLINPNVVVKCMKRNDLDSQGFSNVN